MENNIGYIYVLTPVGITEKTKLTSQFLRRKMDEYEVLKGEIEELKSEICSASDYQIPFSK